VNGKVALGVMNQKVARAFHVNVFSQRTHTNSILSTFSAARFAGIQTIPLGQEVFEKTSPSYQPVERGAVPLKPRSKRWATNPNGAIFRLFCDWENIAGRGLGEVFVEAPSAKEPPEGAYAAPAGGGGTAWVEVQITGASTD
jgi:hypothetical protein